MKKINVAIVGAGAIGSSIASFIYKSKFIDNFSLVDINQAHINKVNNDGLKIINTEGELETFSIKIEKKINFKCDLIIICVKSIATVSVCKKYLKYLKHDGYFLSFQNGINNENIIKIVGNDNYLAGVVGFGATFKEPGLIEITSREISCVIGSLDNKYNKNFKNIFNVVKGIGDLKISSNIVGEQWSKLAINCVTAPLGAIYKMKFGQLVHNRKIRRMMFVVLNEVIAVGMQNNINFAKLGNKVDIIRSFKIHKYYNNVMYRKIRLMVRGYAILVYPFELFRANLVMFMISLKHGKMESSMWQDLKRMSKTEIDFLNGYIVSLAKKYHINCAINKDLTKKINLLERNF